MIWFWVGFFTFVAFLLALDLGVLHRKNETPSIKSAAYWTIAWMSLGLAFTGFVFLMYDNAWLDATLMERNEKTGVLEPSTNPGPNASFMYVSAYLLEYALSVDNIFVISLLFTQFRIPSKYQHRILFWGIMGAIVFRLSMLSGGAFLAQKFDWIFYIFGAYLAYQGFGLLRHDDGGDEEAPKQSLLLRILRRWLAISDGDHEGKFRVIINGKKYLTTAALCLISIELTDVVFALDSIPAVLSVSEDVFIMVTSNIFAILGLRSLYFVLAGAMDKFRYLKIALAILLMLIGVKLFLHNHVHVPHAISLAGIAGIIGTGVLASVIASRREEEEARNSLQMPKASGEPPPPDDEPKTPDKPAA
jgi:tellurite resistance protein TerC